MNSILVNKNNPLDKTYVPKNLVICDDNENNFHGYIDPSLKPCVVFDVLVYFNALKHDAYKDGIRIIIDSGYRSYEYQSKIWDYYVKTKGIEYATSYVALPGTSEHQTGLAIDIASFENNVIDDDITEESIYYKWMIENAYKYVFILRYPKYKENITGYNFEPWHYRFVGPILATKMYNEQITLEEYHQNKLLLLKK